VASKLLVEELRAETSWHYTQERKNWGLVIVSHTTQGGGVVLVVERERRQGGDCCMWKGGYMKRAEAEGRGQERSAWKKEGQDCEATRRGRPSGRQNVCYERAAVAQAERWHVRVELRAQVVVCCVGSPEWPPL